MGIVKDGGSKGFQGRNPREDSNLSPSHFEVKVQRKLNRKKGTKGAKALKAFTCLCFMCLFVARKAVHDCRSWTASVNCWVWPVNLLNHPNELAGSEVRPQPPHCDKNSYIFESPPFQCCSNHKIQWSERQPLFLFVIRGSPAQ